MPDGEKALWKRHAITSALVGSVAVLVFHAITTGLAGTGVFAKLPWRVGQAVVFLGLLGVPGLYFGMIATGFLSLLSSFLLPKWLGMSLIVVFNAVIYSASWMAIRRGGPDAGLRRFGVFTPWFLYGCFVALSQGVSRGD